MLIRCMSSSTCTSLNLRITSSTSRRARAAGLLGVMPEKTLGFAAINGLGRTDGKLIELGQQMQLPVPSLLTKLKEQIDVEKGLDEKGSAAIVAMPGKDTDSEPIMLVFVPVTDFKQFGGQLGAKDAQNGLVEVGVMRAKFLVGNKGEYAVFAEPKHRETLVAALVSSDRVAAELGAWREWLAENDAGFRVGEDRLIERSALEGRRPRSGTTQRSRGNNPSSVDGR